MFNLILLDLCQTVFILTPMNMFIFSIDMINLCLVTEGVSEQKANPLFLEIGYTHL